MPSVSGASLGVPALTGRQRREKRMAALQTRRSSHEAHWEELSKFFQPRRIRLSQTEVDRGTKRNENIINSTATFALRQTVSGLQAGVTSPARQWFRLRTQDPDLMESAAVKVWLEHVETRVNWVLSRSNFYNAAPCMYESMALFGTAAVGMEEDAKTVLRFYPLPIGQYWITQDSTFRVNGIFREMSYTVDQLVQRFGYDRCSSHVRASHDNYDLDQLVTVVHAIEQNTDANARGPLGMPWRSCWWEKDSDEVEYLLESGFEEFPFLVPRWNVNAEDTWGSSPAMDILGDVKALQNLERRKGHAIDKIVNPPMKGPASMRGKRVSLLAGDMNYVDTTSGSQTLEPAITIPPQILALREEIAAHEFRINRGMYADLWMMLSDREGQPITAAEVAERHEEKLLSLGPMLERTHEEGLRPLIERCVGALLRRGMLPEPPDEIQGQEMKIEFVSILAQAQKQVAVHGLERTVAFATALAGVVPATMDVVDCDQAVQDFADAQGVSPRIIRSDEDIARVRQQRVEQEQMAQAAAMAKPLSDAAQAAKTLSETDPTQQSMLNAISRQAGSAVPDAPVGGMP